MLELKLSFLVSFILLIIHGQSAETEWNTKDYFKREHSLIKPYQSTGMTIPYWDFLGSTMVTNNYVRLTADEQSRFGALWNSVPCHTRNWELQVQFKITGKGKELFGDGMAIWYSRDRMQPGPVFGSTDFFSGLVILIDTYSNHNGEHNHQHPYISAMINNGSMHYDHDRDGTHTQVAGCEAKMRNVDHDTHIAIRYEYDTLTVFTDFEKKNSWKECFSVAGVRLPTGYYFGMSAATGDLSDNHDVVGVRMYELFSDERDKEDRSKITPSAISFEPPREHISDPKSSTSGFKIFLYLVFGSIAVVACVIVGVMVYQKHKEKSRKRFY
ncbi:vesicular integral-membrane protein VIP36 [Planococcus citri]|uniref:vesicular integral-membrane protein VIP36 n=1 Tax=Planococcus citri TaxID=170843 RepID=UPI0031F9FF7F